METTDGCEIIQKTLEVTLPIRTYSEANSTEHWSKKNRRHKKQQNQLWTYFLCTRPPIKLPCTIKLIRIAPKTLDAHDNLPMAFKFIVDKLADYIIPGKVEGHADSDSRITWQYDQIKTKEKDYHIKIEVFN